MGGAVWLCVEGDLPRPVHLRYSRESYTFFNFNTYKAYTGNGNKTGTVLYVACVLAGGPCVSESARTVCGVSLV